MSQTQFPDPGAASGTVCDLATATGPADPCDAGHGVGSTDALAQELEALKVQLEEADQKIEQLTGWERMTALDARDALVDRMQALAAQLPGPTDDVDCPDNVVDMTGAPYDSDGRRNILVTPKVYAMLEAATEAFADANIPPRIFQRARRLARLECDQLSGEEVLVDIQAATFTSMLSKMINFCKQDFTNIGHPKLVPVFPYVLVVKAMMESPPRSAPVIKRIAHCPYVRKGNNYIVRDKGYQPEHIYMAQDFTSAILVPETPSKEEVKTARELICDELLGDFPFATPSDKAHAVTALLEALVSEIVDGPYPLHLFEACVQDSGKTHLGDVVSMIAKGRPSDWFTLSGDKEEQTKTLAAKLLQLPTIISIDNLKVALDLPLLEAALTGSVEVRILGRSEMSPTLDTRGIIFIVTINNAETSDDLIRRLVRSRLEPNTERPGERVFRHPDLLAWVKEHRMRLIAALLTLVKNWTAQGAKPYTTRKLSSFTNWSQVMGGILEAADIPGFLDDRAIREEMKSEGTSEWHAFVASWQRHFGYGRVTAREVLDELVAPTETRYSKDGASYSVTPEAVKLLPDSMGATKIGARSRKLGQLLRGRRQQIFHGLKICFQHDRDQNQNLYWLEQIDPPPQHDETMSEAGDFCEEE